MVDFSASLEVPSRDVQRTRPDQLIDDMCTGIERVTELGLAANFFIRRGQDEGFRNSLAAALAYTARLATELSEGQQPIPNELSSDDMAVLNRLMYGYHILGSEAITTSIVTEEWHDIFAGEWRGKTVAIWRRGDTPDDVGPASYRITNTVSENVSGRLGPDRAFTGTIVDLGIKHKGAILLARGFEQIYDEVSVGDETELEARARNRTPFNTANLSSLFELNHQALPGVIEFRPAFSIIEIDNAFDTTHPEFRDE